MTPCVINDKYIIRFCVNGKEINLEDIKSSWTIIQKAAEQVIEDYKLNFQITSPRPNTGEIETSSSLSKLRRKTFTRMTSDPIKFRSLNSLSLKSFDKGFNKLNFGKALQEENEEDI